MALPVYSEPSRPCFPIDKADDLLLFGVWALLAVGAWLAGDKVLANTLTSGWMGAVGVYLKGQSHVTP